MFLYSVWSESGKISPNSTKYLIRERVAMTEREAMDFIERANEYGIVPGLGSIGELCARLGNPQAELTFVHIAGTNGKGSVSAYIASALKAGGYRVGRYISPVIFEYRERIQVNDSMISKKFLCDGMAQISEVCRAMVAEGLPHPTPFEIETVLGFLYFREKKCDIVVLECGMGGALDATNIIEKTAVAVVASVSMDHMKFLGNTLREIAEQKVGIIKSGCRVVSAAQESSVADVIRNRATEMGCALSFVDVNKIKNARYGLQKQFFDYGEYKKLEIALAGRYQLENAALALVALEALADAGYPVSGEKMRKGFREAVWPGRFTVIGRKPLFIVDGAHNEDAAKRLAESAEFYFTNKRIIYIMGVLKDKEYEKIIALTHHLADQIITITPPENPRALPAYELAREISKVHKNVTAVDSPEEAVEMSELLAGKDDVIIAFGSLSFLGRIMNTKASKTGKEAGRNG